jgi:F-type H+-transporting ATPase subunit b
MPQLDAASFPPQLVWLAITFLVLYLVMARVALPRVAEILEARQNRIAGDLNTAAKLKDEAEAVLKEYDRRLAEARVQSQALIREAVDRMAAEAAEREGVLAKRLEVEIKAAEARIADARKAALASIRTVAAEAAQAAVHRLIGGTVDAASAERAVGAAMQERRA